MTLSWHPLYLWWISKTVLKQVWVRGKFHTHHPFYHSSLIFGLLDLFEYGRWWRGGGDVRDAGWIPEWRRSPRGGHGDPLQYSCLENPMDRGAWLQSMGSQGVGHNWTTNTRTYLNQKQTYGKQKDDPPSCSRVKRGMICLLFKNVRTVSLVSPVGDEQACSPPPEAQPHTRGCWHQTSANASAYDFIAQRNPGLQTWEKKKSILGSLNSLQQSWGCHMLSESEHQSGQNPLLVNNVEVEYQFRRWHVAGPGWGMLHF